ncbi:MAG: hypothetical protein R3B06_20355 [Kofleriaceae bacterium]
MAHANLHLAVGLAVGTAAAGLPVLTGLLRRRPLAGPLARTWLVALATGAWALVPNLLSAAGVTTALHHAAWADVFVLHRTIDRRVDGGLLIGELALVAQLVAHYLVLLVALRRTRGRDPAPPAA